MIVLLAHGSPDPRHAVGISTIRDRVAALLDERIEAAYFQHHGPTLIDQAAAAGGHDPKVVRVLPLLVTAGVHLAEDVPAAVAAAARARPDLEWHLLDPMPPRLLAAAAAAEVERFDDVSEVVLVAAGSNRPGALTQFDALAVEVRAVLIEGGLGDRRARLAAGTTARREIPPISVVNGPAGVLDAADRGVFVPVMFADGSLADALRGRAGDHRVSEVLGQTPEGAAAIAEWLGSTRYPRTT